MHNIPDNVFIISKCKTYNSKANHLCLCFVDACCQLSFQEGINKHLSQNIKQITAFIVLVFLMFYIPVNSYGHVEMVS